MPGIGAAGRTGSYRDRQHAGEVLARCVAERELVDPVVLGLARGGVPVAAEVARVLRAPLLVTVARKIGAPGQPELALGAVTAHGPAIWDERLLSAFPLSEPELAEACEREREEARSRERRFGQETPPRLAGRDAVLVDDGLATGATARAAVRMLREELGPRSILLAVPVGSPEAVRLLEQEADEVLCVLQPVGFSAVGQFYGSFRATSDEEIFGIIDESSTGSGVG